MCFCWKSSTFLFKSALTVKYRLIPFVYSSMKLFFESHFVFSTLWQKKFTENFQNNWGKNISFILKVSWIQFFPCFSNNCLNLHENLQKIYVNRFIRYLVWLSEKNNEKSFYYKYFFKNTKINIFVMIRI